MKILVVVDMQNDFIDGALGTPEAQAIVPNVAAKVAEYSNEDGIIIFTRDTHEENYLDTSEGKHLPVKHCIHQTHGWEISKDVYTPFYSYILDKPTFGSVELSGAIGRALRNRGAWGVESIELCGVCTDICVISNALILKADYIEVPIIVDSSCCAGVTPAKHEAALEVMRSCQIDVK